MTVLTSLTLLNLKIETRLKRVMESSEESMAIIIRFLRSSRIHPHRRVMHYLQTH